MVAKIIAKKLLFIHKPTDYMFDTDVGSNVVFPRSALALIG